MTGGELNMATFTDGIDRIIKQIRPYLIEFPAESIDRRQVLLDVESQMDRFTLCLGSQNSQRTGQAWFQMDTLGNRNAIHFCKTFDRANQMVDPRCRFMNFGCQPPNLATRRHPP